jgi:uncharacterized membrane protein
VSLLAPLGLALAALAVPLVLLYFVRPRPRERTVSSLLLWPARPRERAPLSLLQRFEADPLILLQLAALAALAAALARPVLTVPGEPDRRVVLILDTSASMKATDVRPSRFEAARERALALARGLPEGAQTMVIEAGVQPRIAARFGAERSRVLDALRAASARDAPDRLEEAIRTALALVGGDERAEIHVFTDGAFGELPGPADPRIRWVGVGGGSDNVAITRLAVRKTQIGAGNYEALVSLANYAPAPRRLRLSVQAGERAMVEREIELGAQVRRSLILPFRHGGEARIRAELRANDALAVDNVAWAVLPAPRRIAVTLVSEGNLFLENVLRADPEVVLTVKRPAQYAGGMEAADVVVLDSATPPRIGPGRFVLVNTVPPDLPVELLGTISAPSVLDWDHAHPVMRHVEFSKVVIRSAMRLRPLAPGRTLVEAALGGPLVYALEEPGRKALLVGFDLFEADLPLRVAFPLLMSNALRWLHPGASDHASLQIGSGQPIVLPLAHGVDAVTVTTPSGRRLPARIARGEASFADTEEIGVYTLATGRGEVRIAVNLMDSAESDIAPRPLPAPAALAAAERVPVEVEIWRHFAFAALLLLALEAALYGRRQSAGRLVLRASPGARRALGARGALLALLAVALARPELPQSLDRMNVAFVFDHSESVSEEARDRALEFAQEAVRHAKTGDRHSVIVFGADAVVDQPLGARRSLAAPRAQVDGRQTNLFQALQLALAILPPAQTNRIVLFGDGRPNAGDALAAARAAGDAAVPVYYVAAALALEQEVIAESLVLPREVRFGETFHVRLVAWSRKATGARVALFRNGRFAGAQRVELAAGRNVLAYRQSLDEEGLHVYQAVIEADGDTLERNNRAVGAVLVRGRPVVLVVDGGGNHARPIASALRAQQLQVTVVAPSALPRATASLARYDGVVLANVSATDLAPAQMASLRDYVRDHGGGLVMVGGDRSFGVGGYYQTAIEEALPVSMDVKQRLDVPNLSIVLSIDRSASMTSRATGNVTFLDLAKEAAHLVVDLLDERAEVGVMSWDTEFRWDVPLRPARDKAAIHSAIASIVYGGGTDGYPALRESHQVLARRPSVLKHVIFLSDGHMRTDHFQELVERMAEDRITVSTVAVGQGADERLLQNIARWGRGRFYRTEDSQSLPRIFAVETQLASNTTVVDQPFRPRLVQGAHEAVQDIDWKNVPALGGYIATTPKAGAEQVLVSHLDDPVLATWRFGLGRAAAFTSDAASRWSQQWREWREFARFWSQLVRWTLRSAAREPTSASVERRGGFGEVVLEAADASGRFLNLLAPQVGVVAPDKSRTVIELEQAAPGRYVGRFPAQREGVYLVGIAKRPGEKETGSQLLALVVPYAEELRELGVDEATLREIAAASGGAEIADPRDVFLKDRKPFVAMQEIWPWYIALAALVLLFDIALRRIGPQAFGRLRQSASTRIAR